MVNGGVGGRHYSSLQETWFNPNSMTKYRKILYYHVFKNFYSALGNQWSLGQLLWHSQLWESLDGWAVLLEGCAFSNSLILMSLNWLYPDHHSCFCLFLALSSACKIGGTNIKANLQVFSAKPEYPQLFSYPSSVLHSPSSNIFNRE